MTKIENKFYEFCPLGKAVCSRCNHWRPKWERALLLVIGKCFNFKLWHWFSVHLATSQRRVLYPLRSAGANCGLLTTATAIRPNETVVRINSTWWTVQHSHAPPLRTAAWGTPPLSLMDQLSKGMNLRLGNLLHSVWWVNIHVGNFLSPRSYKSNVHQ